MGTYSVPSNNHQRSISSFYLSQGGKEGGLLFNDAGDRIYFITLLKQAALKYKNTTLAYSLLNNQYDLLLRIPKPNLSHFMHLINSGYANYYNRHHQRQQRVFGEHFKSFLIEEKLLAEASLYLHLLPNLKKETKSLLRFRWSSLSGYIEKEKQEAGIDYGPILSQFEKRDADAPAAYKAELICRLQSKKKPLWTPLNAEKVPRDKKTSESMSLPAHNDFNLAIQIKNAVSKEKRIPPLAARNAAIFFIKKYIDLNNGQISRLFSPLKKSSISQMSQRYRNLYETEPSMREAADQLEIKIKELVDKEVKTGISA